MSHLHLLPAPSEVRLLDTEAALDRAGWRGDLVRQRDRAHLIAQRQEDIIGQLAEQVAELTEERDELRARLARRAPLWLALWAGACDLWATAWDWFETPASRAALRG